MKFEFQVPELNNIIYKRIFDDFKKKSIKLLKKIFNDLDKLENGDEIKNIITTTFIPPFNENKVSIKSTAKFFSELSKEFKNAEPIFKDIIDLGNNSEKEFNKYLLSNLEDKKKVEAVRNLTSINTKSKNVLNITDIKNVENVSTETIESLKKEIAENFDESKLKSGEISKDDFDKKIVDYLQKLDEELQNDDTSEERKLMIKVLKEHLSEKKEDLKNFKNDKEYIEEKESSKKIQEEISSKLSFIKNQYLNSLASFDVVVKKVDETLKNLEEEEKTADDERKKEIEILKEILNEKKASLKSNFSGQEIINSYKNIFKNVNIDELSSDEELTKKIKNALETNSSEIVKLANEFKDSLEITEDMDENQKNTIKALMDQTEKLEELYNLSDEEYKEKLKKEKEEEEEKLKKEKENIKKDKKSEKDDDDENKEVLEGENTGELIADAFIKSTTSIAGYAAEKTGLKEWIEDEEDSDKKDKDKDKDDDEDDDSEGGLCCKEIKEGFQKVDELLKKVLGIPETKTEVQIPEIKFTTEKLKPLLAPQNIKPKQLALPKPSNPAALPKPVDIKKIKLPQEEISGSIPFGEGLLKTQIKIPNSESSKDPIVKNLNAIAKEVGIVAYINKSIYEKNKNPIDLNKNNDFKKSPNKGVGSSGVAGMASAAIAGLPAVMSSGSDGFNLGNIVDMIPKSWMNKAGGFVKKLGGKATGFIKKFSGKAGSFLEGAGSKISGLAEGASDIIGKYAAPAMFAYTAGNEIYNKLQNPDETYVDGSTRGATDMIGAFTDMTTFGLVDKKEVSDTLINSLDWWKDTLSGNERGTAAKERKKERRGRRYDVLVKNDPNVSALPKPFFNGVLKSGNYVFEIPDAAHKDRKHFAFYDPKLKRWNFMGKEVSYIAMHQIGGYLSNKKLHTKKNIDKVNAILAASPSWNGGKGVLPPGKNKVYDMLLSNPDDIQNGKLTENGVKILKRLLTIPNYKSDAEKFITEYSKQFGMDPKIVEKQVGYQPGSDKKDGKKDSGKDGKKGDISPKNTKDGKPAGKDGKPAGKDGNNTKKGLKPSDSESPKPGDGETPETNNEKTLKPKKISSPKSDNGNHLKTNSSASKGITAKSEQGSSQPDIPIVLNQSGGGGGTSNQTIINNINNYTSLDLIFSIL